jgi:hypothetical protein
MIYDRNEKYTPSKKCSQPIWDAPPPMIDLKRVKWPGDPPKDWTGHRLGRLTVVGYWGANMNRNGEGTCKHQWICRCVCGKYTMRNARTIKKAQERSKVHDMCDLCRHHQHLVKTEHFLRTGRRLHLD